MAKFHIKQWDARQTLKSGFFEIGKATLTGKPGARNPNEYYPFSTGKTFEGVVSSDGRWKLHLPHRYRTLAEAGQDGMPGKYTQTNIELSLFDMDNDPYETTNVLDAYPEVADRLKHYAEKHRQKFYTDG